MPLSNPGISELEVARKNVGLTARELAAAVEISPSYISQIERGWRRPSWTVMRKLGVVLGYHVLALFPEADEKST